MWPEVGRAVLFLLGTLLTVDLELLSETPEQINWPTGLVRFVVQWQAKGRQRNKGPDCAVILPWTSISLVQTCSSGLNAFMVTVSAGGVCFSLVRGTEPTQLGVITGMDGSPWRRMGLEVPTDWIKVLWLWEQNPLHVSRKQSIASIWRKVYHLWEKHGGWVRVQAGLLLCEVHLWSKHLAVTAGQPFCGSGMSQDLCHTWDPPPPTEGLQRPCGGGLRTAVASALLLVLQATQSCAPRCCCVGDARWNETESPNPKAGKFLACLRS